MSQLRNRVKSLIKDIVAQQQQTSGAPSYTFGSVSALSNDGSVLVVDSNGNEVTAFPKYPVVLGQNVVLVNNSQGAISAVPVGASVQPVQIIHPPFFTGGGPKLRFIVPESVDSDGLSKYRFQDFGNSNLYRFKMPNVVSVGNYIAKMSLSPNGRNFVAWGYTSLSGTVRIVAGYALGQSLTSSGTIDPVNKIFSLSPTSINSYTQTILGGFHVSIANYMLAVYIDNQGNIFYLTSTETTDPYSWQYSGGGPGSGVLIFGSYVDSTSPALSSYNPIDLSEVGRIATIVNARITGSPSAWSSVVNVVQPTFSSYGSINCQATPGASMGRSIQGAAASLLYDIYINGVFDHSEVAAVDYAVFNEIIVELDLLKNGVQVNSWMVNPGGTAPSPYGTFRNSSFAILDGNRSLLAGYNELSNSGHGSIDIIDISVPGVLGSLSSGVAFISFLGQATQQGSSPVIVKGGTNTISFGSVDSKNEIVAWSCSPTPILTGPVLFDENSTGYWWDSGFTRHVFGLSNGAIIGSSGTLKQGVAISGVSPGQSDSLAVRQLSSDYFFVESFFMGYVS